LYWRGAVLGDLGRHREALRAIETALRVVTAEDHWLLEDLYYEKVTILDALGLHDAAVASCEAGLERCPGSALLRAALAPAERARVRAQLKVLRGGV
jgi:tetratricopeptide (TPR) repeat protein